MSIGLFGLSVHASGNLVPDIFHAGRQNSD